MKRESLIFAATICLAVLFPMDGFGSSRTFLSASSQPQKKERTIKMLTSQDGKLTVKDSSAVKGSGNKVVVIGTSLSAVADSLYHGLGSGVNSKRVTVTVTDDAGNGGKGNTFTYTIGDTLKQDEEHKVFRIADGKHAIIMQDGAGENFTVPAVGGNLPFRFAKARMLDNYGFNPNDTSIISYKKKDLGKGLEKITIIRKKGGANQ